MPNLVWNQEIYGHVLRSHLSPATRWLDAGCGHHLLPHGLDKLVNELVAIPRFIVGADVSILALRGNRWAHSLVGAKLDALPFEDESFDLVTCNMVVEHLHNPAGGFRELVRVLRPRGRLIVHTPNLLNYAVCAGHVLKLLLPRWVFLRILGWSDKRASEDVFPTFYRANTCQKLRQLFRELGLAPETCRTLVGPQPIFNFFAPVALVEILLKKLLLLKALKPFRTTILISFCKPEMKQAVAPAPATCVAAAHEAQIEYDRRS
jgi:SAM-dependent methyltransferase